MPLNENAWSAAVLDRPSDAIASSHNDDANTDQAPNRGGRLCIGARVSRPTFFSLLELLDHSRELIQEFLAIKPVMHDASVTVVARVCVNDTCRF